MQYLRDFTPNKIDSVLFITIYMFYVLYICELTMYGMESHEANILVKNEKR